VFNKYEGGGSLASIPREFDLATSAVNDILNNDVCTKKNVSNVPRLGNTVIT
jgi:hypothetical protein